MGFTKKELEHMYFGEWQAYFEVYKKIYNFEISRQMFDSGCLKESALETESLGSIDDL